MTTEPDEDVELLALFVKGAMALHPNLDPDGDALEALASLESQNQALQERAEKAEAALRELADALYDRRIYDNGIPQYEPTRNRKEVRLIHALNAARALSPTQETDPG